MEEKEYKYGEDYYKMLNDENFSTLLDREVQMENARERALRQTNVGLASLGMQSSGYGQTAKSGIEGQYLNALNQANRDYLTQDAANLANTRNYMDSRFNNLTTELGSYDMSSEESRNKVLSNYGLMKDGVLDEEEFKKMYGENNLGAFKNILDTYKSGDAEDISTIPLDDYNIAVETLKDQNEKAGNVNDELKRIFNKDDFAKLGYEPQNGDVMKISANSDANASTTYIIYKDGKWYPSDKKAYANATNKHWFRSSKNSHDKFYFDESTVQYETDFDKFMNTIAGYFS